MGNEWQPNEAKHKDRFPPIIKKKVKKKVHKAKHKKKKKTDES